MKPKLIKPHTFNPATGQRWTDSEIRQAIKEGHTVELHCPCPSCGADLRSILRNDTTQEGEAMCHVQHQLPLCDLSSRTPSVLMEYVAQRLQGNSAEGN